MENSSTFSQYLNSETYPVIYNDYGDRKHLKADLLSQFIAIDRVCFVFHGPPTDSPFAHTTKFIHDEMFFTITGDTVVGGENHVFLQELCNALHVKNIDFLACNLLQSVKWKDYFALFQNVVVGASIDDTGNVKYGGDWVMESTMEDVRDIYLNKNLIDNYTSLLVDLFYSTVVDSKTLTYTYTLDASNNASITDLSSNNFTGTLVVPESIEGFPVKTVGGLANNIFSSLVIPRYAVTLADSALYKGNDAQNHTLTTVQLPEGLITIGSVAFYQCRALSSINIPSSVTTIAGSAFNSCTALTNITIPPGVTYIGGRAFKSCFNLWSIVIPSSVTVLLDGCFWNCINLTDISISTETTIIEKWVFLGCDQLSTITLPEGLLTIGSGAFQETNITAQIPSTVTRVEFNAFRYCRGYTNVIIPASVKTWTNNPLGDKENNAFANCINITTVTFAHGCTVIPVGMFSSCSKLTTINIPNTMTTILRNAFYDCSESSGIKVVFPRSVTTIGSLAFQFTPVNAIYFCGNSIPILDLSANVPPFNQSSLTPINTYYLSTVTNTTALSGFSDPSHILIPLTPIAMYNQMVTDSVSVYNIYNGGFLSTEFLRTQYTTQQLVAAGITMAQLYAEGFLTFFEIATLNTYYSTFYTVSETTPTVMTRTIYDDDGTLMDTADITFGGQKITDVMALVSSGTNPFTVGIVDSSQTKIPMDIAFFGLYPKQLTPSQKSKLMSYVDRTYKEPHTIYTAQYTVTVFEGAFRIVAGSTVQNFAFNPGGIYLFDQSDSSNQGSESLVFSSSPSSSTALAGVTLLSYGTPGYMNAYSTVTTTTAIASAYIYTGTVYYMSVVRNNADNLVFAVSTEGQTGLYYTQLDLSFGAGAKVTFDVSHPSVANYTLRFGTNGTPDETYVTRRTITKQVTLTIPQTYSGANIYYFSDNSVVSSYEVPTIKYKGQPRLTDTDTPTNWSNAGIGMPAFTKYGDKMAFYMKNDSTLSRGIVYDFSLNTNLWVKTVTASTGGGTYQMDPYLDSGNQLKFINGSFFFNDTGTVCVATGVNYQGSGGYPGGFIVYVYSSASNTWIPRGGSFSGIDPEWLTFDFDTDSTCDTLVAGSKGNYIRIYKYNIVGNNYLIYNSTTKTYSSTSSNSFTGDTPFLVSSTNSFGRIVRMNNTGTKIMAVAPDNYTRIYNYSSNEWILSYTIPLVSGIVRTPSHVFATPNGIVYKFISKALDLYIAVDTSNITYVYTVNDAGVAALRDTIPEYALFTATERSVNTAQFPYSYRVSLSGNGNRIFILGGWPNPTGLSNSVSGKAKAVIMDYNPSTGLWTQVYQVIGDDISQEIFPMVYDFVAGTSTKVTTRNFGAAVKMTDDGSTIVVTNPFGNTSAGEFHVLKCVTPQTFSYITYKVTVLDGVFVLTDSNGTSDVQSISLNPGITYLFDQSDSSNTGTVFRLSSIFASMTEITSGVTRYNTPGTSNAYMTVLPVFTSTAYLYNAPVMTYYAKVATNISSNPVFAISTTTAEGTYYNQPDIPFVAGNKYKFFVSDSSVAGYPLVFGSDEIANPSLYTSVGIPGQAGAYVTLNLTSGYTGTTIRYFGTVRTGMGYSPFVSSITNRGWTLLFRQTHPYVWGDTQNPGLESLRDYPTNNANYSILSDMSGTTRFMIDGKYTFKYVDPSNNKFVTWSQTSNMTTTRSATSNYTLLSTNGTTTAEMSGFGGISLTNAATAANVWYDCSPSPSSDWWFGLAFKQSSNFAAYPFATFPSTAEADRKVIELYVWDKTEYTVSIVEGVIYLNGISNPVVTFVAGGRYIFDQSENTNTGNPISFSRLSNGNPIFTDGVTNVGTPGQVGAYTSIDVPGSFTGTLYYILFNNVQTFDIITTSTGSKFYYNADTPANYVLDASNNVIRWKNRISGGIDASANTYGGYNNNQFPKIVTDVSFNSGGLPFMKFQGGSYQVGFNYNGGSIQTGEFNQQTFFMFGYMYGTNANTFSLGMFFTKPGPYEGRSLHIGWDNYNNAGKLSVINTAGNAYSTNTINQSRGYYMMSITVDCSGGTTKGTVNIQAYGITDGTSQATRVPYIIDDGTANKELNSQNRTNDLHDWQIGYWEAFGTTNFRRSLNSVIGETMYFNRILSKNERYILEGKIAWKYGQAAILPDTHPYKTFPPSEYTTTTIIISVTVSNMAYIINGSAVPNGTINLLRGYTYQINVDAPGHPFYIQTSSGSYSAGNTTITGVTNNGTSTITIVVSATTPQQLYYACSIHTNMYGSIVVT